MTRPNNDRLATIVFDAPRDGTRKGCFERFQIGRQQDLYSFYGQQLVYFNDRWRGYPGFCGDMLLGMMDIGLFVSHCAQRTP